MILAHGLLPSCIVCVQACATLWTQPRSGTLTTSTRSCTRSSRKCVTRYDSNVQVLAGSLCQSYAAYTRHWVTDSAPPSPPKVDRRDRAQSQSAAPPPPTIEAAAAVALAAAPPFAAPPFAAPQAALQTAAPASPFPYPCVLAAARPASGARQAGAVSRRLPTTASLARGWEWSPSCAAGCQ